MRQIHALAIAMLGVTLAGCAAGPALFGASTGHVTGTVTVRACGGAAREDQSPCHVSSASEAQVVFQLEGATEKQISTTGPNGQYGIDLKPGTYTVRVDGIRVTTVRVSPGDAASPLPPAVSSAGRISGPTTIAVMAGKTVTADFTVTIQLL